jgi:protein SCO1/2
MIDLVTPASRSTTYASSSTSPTRQRPPLLPLVITCDPARDTPSVLKTYLAEFHPAMLGLTGTWEQIKQVCKAYRVYFSTPEGVKPGMDYLVDHSIYFYLMGAFPFLPPFLIDSKPPTYPGNDIAPPQAIYMRFILTSSKHHIDPEGDFVEAIGRQQTAEQAAKMIADHMSDWNGAVKKKR